MEWSGSRLCLLCATAASLCRGATPLPCGCHQCHHSPSERRHQFPPRPPYQHSWTVYPRPSAPSQVRVSCKISRPASGQRSSRGFRMSSSIVHEHLLGLLGHLGEVGLHHLMRCRILLDIFTSQNPENFPSFLVKRNFSLLNTIFERSWIPRIRKKTP